MIKIDDSTIKEIKENHLKAVKNIIKESVERFKYISSKRNYILKDKKGNIICNFDSKYKKFIEEFVGAKIVHSSEKVVLNFDENGTKIESIISGDLNKTIDIFLNLFQEKYKEELEIKNILKVNYNMKQVVSKIDKTVVNKATNEINQSRKIIIDEFVNLYKEFIDDEFLSKYEIVGENGFSKMITNKTEFKNYFKLKKEYVYKINKYKDSNEILKYIFDYEKLCDGISIEENHTMFSWNRHELISKMGVRTCPYCNRQYITNYKDKNKQNKTTADLDHFYSKSEYPFLALSLYNFIPSCQICNSRFKIADNFYYEPHIYPYKEGFGEEVKFKTNFYTDKDVERKESNESLEKDCIYDVDYLLGNSDNFKIELQINKDRIKNKLIEECRKENKKIDLEIECKKYENKIQNSIITFHLEELYNFHKDYVREIIKKAVIYNESKIDELYTEYPELFSSREEVLQMVVSNYIDTNDLGKRPLAKLTKDIWGELGLK